MFNMLFSFTPTRSKFSLLFRIYNYSSVNLSSTMHTICLIHSQPFLWQSFTNSKNYETSYIRQSLPSFQSTNFLPNTLHHDQHKLRFKCSEYSTYEAECDIESPATQLPLINHFTLKRSPASFLHTLKTSVNTGYGNYST